MVHTADSDPSGQPSPSEHDEALKLALKLSLEEYKGNMQSMGRYVHQQSGFFDSMTHGDDSCNNGEKEKNDVVSMEFILERMHDLHKIIKKEVNYANEMKTSGADYSSQRAPRATMSRNSLTDLIELLFGSEETRLASPDDIISWCKQGFCFNEDPNLFWALSQTYPTCCGVLAAVQSYMLNCLLFHQAIYGSMEHMLVDEPADLVLMKLRTIYFNFITVNHPDFPQEWLHIPSLLEALCALLYNVTPVSKYTVVLFEPLKRTTGLNPIHSIIYNSNYIYKEFNSVADVAAFLLQNLHLLMCEMGVLSFTLSLLATRGIANVQKDMDEPNQPLIGLHGHSTQELVNLMLQGRAVSNLFDGEKVIQEGGNSACFKLKGITKPMNVGFLTELEARRYCKVGSLYKHPKMPIWVISSLNHYTVMFSMKPNCCKRSEREIYEDNAMNVWGCLDPDDNRFIPKNMLPSLLEMLAIPASYNEACSSLRMESDIILQIDFMEWYLSQIVNANLNREEREITVLFQYNGMERRSPLTMVTVRHVTSEEIAVMRLGEQMNDHAGIDADIVGYARGDALHLARTVWTRWPRTFVEILPLTTTPSTREQSENELA